MMRTKKLSCKNYTGQQQNLNGDCKKCPESILDADLKNVIIFFVAHLVFEVCVCFGSQLPSLPQACEQQKIVLFAL